eukprot:3394519-Rhodomonas_salina.1
MQNNRHGSIGHLGTGQHSPRARTNKHNQTHFNLQPQRGLGYYMHQMWHPNTQTPRPALAPSHPHVRYHTKPVSIPPPQQYVQQVPSGIRTTPTTPIWHSQVNRSPRLVFPVDATMPPAPKKRSKKSLTQSVQQTLLAILQYIVTPQTTEENQIEQQTLLQQLDDFLTVLVH